MSSNFHTPQRSDWAAPVQSVNTSQNSKKQKKSNVSCKPLQWWSALPPIIRGILLGALVNCVVLIIILPIWLVKPSAKTTRSPSNAPVLRWNTTGTTVAGRTGVIGLSADTLQSPWDLVVDWADTIYVTDRFNNRVQKFLRGAGNGSTIAGQSNGISGTAANQFDQPTGIYADSSGNIYVSDVSNNRVQYWSNGATSGQTVVGNGTIGSDNNLLYNPYGIWRDTSSGNLYLADSYNHRIMRYAANSLTGNIVAGVGVGGTATFQLFFPYGFYFDSLSNSLLIANAGANNIVRWTIGASNWTLVAGDGNGISGSTATLLMVPTDVALDPMGNMYVADMQNHRIQFFSAGQSSGVTIAGITGLVGSNATLLFSPSSVALDNQLNLYVVDQNNYRIQKFQRY